MGFGDHKITTVASAVIGEDPKRDGGGRAGSHGQCDAARTPAHQQQRLLQYALPDTAGAQFLATHPGVTLDLVLSDAVVDLMEERADVAIRTEPLRDSSLMIRKLGSTRMVVVASPAYLEQHGTPRHPGDLARHKGIGWTFQRAIGGWPFRNGDGVEEHMPPIIARPSNREAARLLALGGIGLARLARFQVEADIASDALMPVLEDVHPGGIEDIHADYLGGPSPLPARVRAFVDFMASQCRFPES